MSNITTLVLFATGENNQTFTSPSILLTTEVSSNTTIHEQFSTTNSTLLSTTMQTPDQSVPVIAISATISAFFMGILITLLFVCLYFKLRKPKTVVRKKNDSTRRDMNRENCSSLYGYSAPYSVIVLDTDLNANSNAEESSQNVTGKADDDYVDMKGRRRSPDYVNTPKMLTKSAETKQTNLKKSESTKSQVYEPMEYYHSVDSVHDNSPLNNQVSYINVIAEENKTTEDTISIYEPYEVQIESNAPSNSKAKVPPKVAKKPKKVKKTGSRAEPKNMNTTEHYNKIADISSQPIHYGNDLQSNNQSKLQLQNSEKYVPHDK